MSNINFSVTISNFLVDSGYATSIVAADEDGTSHTIKFENPHNNNNGKIHTKDEIIMFMELDNN